jgi:hypothetical protein
VASPPTYAKPVPGRSVSSHHPSPSPGAFRTGSLRLWIYRCNL